MRFTQAVGGAEQTLRFEAYRLVVVAIDARTAREYALGYLDIDLERAPPAAAGRGLAVRLAAWARAARAPYAVFPLFDARPGRETLAIWDTRDAPAIVAQLQARWRAARRQAVVVDFAADPRKELARFQTLLTRGIVSAEEAAAAAARIAARADQ